MKKIVFLLFGALIALSAVCASSAEINALRVFCKSSADVTIMLDEAPVVRFDNLNLVISTTNNEVSIPSDEALKISYLNVDPDGIISQTMSEPMFFFGKESLNVSNLAPQASVSIYTVDGRLISSATTDADGKASLSLPARSATVYIVRTPGFSLKLYRP